MPELACPHCCVFCDQEKISGNLRVPSPDEVRQIIEEHLSTIPKDGETEIAFFGGNFTGIPVALQENYLKIACEYTETEQVGAVRISTRPDYIDADILKMLKAYRVKTIELGAQSFDDEVLKKSQRGHTADDTHKAAALIKQFGFRLGLQMMTALPGDTPEKALDTARKIVALEALETRIYPALVLKNTSLARMYYAGRYRPQSLDDASELTKDLIKIFEAGNVKILRVGLHPSDELKPGKSLVAGPYHPSFKELALSKRWREILENLLIARKQGYVKILVQPAQVNHAVGYGACNRKYFERRGLFIRIVSDRMVQAYKPQLV